MGSYLKSFAAELLPEWLKAKREGKDAIEPKPLASPAPSEAEGVGEKRAGQTTRKP